MEHAKFAGHRWTDQDDKDKVALYHVGAVTLGVPYVIDYDGTYGECAIAPATEASMNNNRVVVALETSGAGKISKFQEMGIVAQAYAYTCAVDDQLELLNTGTYFVCNGTSESTTRNIKSCAIAMEANAAAAAALIKVLLYREPCQIAAS